MDRNRIAVEIFDKRATGYQDKYMDVSLYRDALNNFCSYLSIKNAEILDIACGPGNITKYLLSQNPDFQITGIDLSRNMIALATKNNKVANFRIMDCRNVESIENKYNGIICGFVLPYLSKVEAIKLIEDCSQKLYDKGILYISTMQDSYTNSKMVKSSYGDEMFMYYHETDYLKAALLQNSFEILELRLQLCPAHDGSQVIDLIITARKTKKKG